jgi:hypothetical protein
MTNVEIVGNLVKVEFSNNITPICLEKNNKDYIFWGEDNNFPGFILSLYKQHAIHNAILKSKAKYIYGKGLVINSEKEKNTINLAKCQSFLSTANRYEDWNSVYNKTVKSLETFNGFVWQIIWSLGGTRCEVYCMQLAKFRAAKDGSGYFYCEKWNSQQPSRHESYKFFPKFNPDVRTGTQIYYYSVEDQSSDELDNIYPEPEYQGCVVNIATDIAIRDFQNNLVENGMTAQGMLSLFNGEPTEEEKKKHAKLFENKHTGPKRAGRIIFNYTSEGSNKGAEFTNFTDSNLDQKFESMIKTNQQDIVTGHQVTNKALVGISTEGALSDRTTIIDSFEQMYNTYVEPRQQIPLGEIRMIASLTGVNLSYLEVQRLTPIGRDITEPHISKYFTEDEIRKELGFKPKEPTAQEVQQSQAGAPVNENLKGLTGSEWIHIKRLVREVSQGKTAREAAAMMIKNAYGLNEDDINVLFGPVQFNQNVFKMFEAAAIDEDENDEIVSEQFVEFHDSRDAIAFEFDQLRKFDMGEPSNRDLVNNVLDLLKGDPTILPEKIAKILGVQSDLIITTINNLIDKKLIERGTGSLTPTDKGIDRNTPIVETEVYTVYKYVERDGLPPLKGQSREWCVKMMELSRSGKVYTREALDNLSNALGESAWSYRGGYYTNPKTKVTTTHCRHVYKAITRSRTKKK